MVAQPLVSGPLYDQVASVGTLRQAWAKVQANNGAAGGDGMTVARFALVADSLIDRLAADLKAGRYRPGPPRRVYVPKKSGGHRPLDIPAVQDRIVQGAATLVLDPILDPHFEDSSFAYRKGLLSHQVVPLALRTADLAPQAPKGRLNFSPGQRPGKRRPNFTKP